MNFRAISSKRLTIHLALIRRFLRRNWKALTVVAVLLFLFNWYELRPVRIHRNCAVQASNDARGLLRSKAEITSDQAERQSYANMLEKNMYLRNDYESFYKKCLRFYAMGIAE